MMRNVGNITVNAVPDTAMVAVFTENTFFYKEASVEAQFTFMSTEQIQITNMQFIGTNNIIRVTINNTGTSAVTINEAWVNNVKKTTTSPSLPATVSANSGVRLNITSTWAAGSNYQVKLVSSKGNQFYYNAVGPQTQTQADVMLYKANVNFYTQGSTKMISVDVGNSGTSNTEIIKIYVGNSSASRAEQTPSQSLPLSLARSSAVTLTVTYSWTAGATYYFRILSSTGQSLEFPEQAPS
jgi:hypothetical protein